MRIKPQSTRWATPLPSIDLHIEELVLHGFAPGDRRAIGGAVERELARLLTEQGLPGRLSAGGSAAHLDGGTFHAAPGARPDVIGAQVAKAVYRGLAK